MVLTAEQQRERRKAKRAQHPRPRGRAPHGCTWDLQHGGWVDDEGYLWEEVRNRKRQEQSCMRKEERERIAQERRIRERPLREEERRLREEQRIEKRDEKRAQVWADVLAAVQRDGCIDYCHYLHIFGEHHNDGRTCAHCKAGVLSYTFAADGSATRTLRRLGVVWREEQLPVDHSKHPFNRIPMYRP